MRQFGRLPYTIVAGGALAKLTRAELLVYCSICAHANGALEAHPSTAGMAAAGGINEKSVRRAISSLAAQGLIEVTARRGARNLYRVRETIGDIQLDLFDGSKRQTPDTQMSALFEESSDQKIQKPGHSDVRASAQSADTQMSALRPAERLPKSAKRGHFEKKRGHLDVRRTEEQIKNRRYISGELDARINSIYIAYPRHVGKAKAIEAIGRALKVIADRGQADPAQWLQDRTATYAAAVATWPEDQRQYIPHPTTWYNQGRFDDDDCEWERRNGNGHPGNGQAKAKPPLTDAEMIERGMFKPRITA